MREGWDFTPVIDLLHSLSIRNEKPSQLESSTRDSFEIPATSIRSADDHETNLGLGNFDKLWRYLGHPLTNYSSISEQNFKSSSTFDRIDGCIIEPASVKGVRWLDQIKNADLADYDETNGSDALDSSKHVAKKERKKKRREECVRVKDLVPMLPSGSEDESKSDTCTPLHTYDRRAIINQILYGAQPKLEVCSKIPQTPEKAQSRRNYETWPAISPRPLRGSLAASLTNEEQCYATAAEKKAKLLVKLQANFTEEREFLKHIGNVTNAKCDDATADMGVHVFVDASNIMIGFQNSVKLSRGISIGSRIRRQPFSFHNLSLILERGRATTKRVLVGSDNFSAIQEAKAIGYETNILERVHKTKELTPRQKKFHYNSSNNNSTTGQSSGSETTATAYAQEKWVEQAVDEILHLKILESVVDARVPSKIVLATGDAAEAEYSQGFLKMVERALEKGWEVELVSFKHNISGAYRKKEFTAKWRKQFKIIPLDEYVEELLGA